jgi:hypothetical protein
VARPAGPAGQHSSRNACPRKVGPQKNGQANSISAASVGSTERSVKVKVKMRTKGLHQKIFALAAGIGITFGLTAIAAPAASASDAPCSGYCYVYDSLGYDPAVYLWDSDNVLEDSSTSAISFAFLNESTWDGRDVYEMYEATTAKCITFSGSKTDGYFSLADCSPGSAEQEFFYNADDYLVSVGATSAFGPFACLIATISGGDTYAAECASSSPPDETWAVKPV